jgi:hypothetical protein
LSDALLRIGDHHGLGRVKGDGRHPQILQGLSALRGVSRHHHIATQGAARHLHRLDVQVPPQGFTVAALAQQGHTHTLLPVQGCQDR